MITSSIVPRLNPGNDLARCLNWGGGMYAYQQAGVGELLGLLEQSAVTLLDRWDVRITQVPSFWRPFADYPVPCAQFVCPSPYATSDQPGAHDGFKSLLKPIQPLLHDVLLKDVTTSLPSRCRSRCGRS